MELGAGGRRGGCYMGGPRRIIGREREDKKVFLWVTEFRVWKWSRCIQSGSRGFNLLNVFFAVVFVVVIAAVSCYFYRFAVVVCWFCSLVDCLWFCCRLVFFKFRFLIAVGFFFIVVLLLKIINITITSISRIIIIIMILLRINIK